MSRFSRDLESSIRDSGLKDGMRISFHHHLRLGDRVVGMVLPALARMGLTDLPLCVSSVMGPACEAALEAVTAGVITRIETTGMKEPLSSAVAAGELEPSRLERPLSMLRSLPPPPRTKRETSTA